MIGQHNCFLFLHPVNEQLEAISLGFSMCKSHIRKSIGTNCCIDVRIYCACFSYKIRHEKEEFQQCNNNLCYEIKHYRLIGYNPESEE